MSKLGGRGCTERPKLVPHREQPSGRTAPAERRSSRLSAELTSVRDKAREERPGTGGDAMLPPRRHRKGAPRLYREMTC